MVAGVTVMAVPVLSLSVKLTFVSAMLPQLVTIPLKFTVPPARIVFVLQTLVTARQGFSVTRHGAVAEFVALTPQIEVPIAVTVLVLPTQPAVKVLL